MGFIRSEKGSIISESFLALCDIGQFKKNSMINVILHEDNLILVKGKEEISLNYSQITDVYYGLETEVVAKNKSPIGRAVAGGLIFGGAGAVVGAISGSGKKEKTINKFIFIISYKSSSGTDAFLEFQDTRIFKGQRLSRKLESLCNIKNEPPEHITSL